MPKTTNYTKYTEALYGESAEKLKKSSEKSKKAKQTRAKNKQLGLTEEALQRQCVKWFDIQYPDKPFALYAVPNGGSRHRLEAINLSKAGVRSGVADLVLMTKYKVVYIEMKNPRGTGSQSAEQKAFEKYAKECNFPYHLIDSFDHFVKVVKGYMNSA